jgi:transcriptional regulator with GAF, ATPase, and Fis domain
MSDQQAAQLRLEREVFQLRTLYEVARTLSHCRDTEAVFRNMLSILTGTFGATRGFAATAESGMWQIAAIRGFDSEVHSTLSALLEDSSFADLTQEKRKERLAKWFGENSTDSQGGESRLLWVQFATDAGSAGGFFIGPRLSGEPYIAADQELAEAAATFAATAVENLRLYEELRDAQERLRRENVALRAEVKRQYAGETFVGQSSAVQKVLTQIERFAHSPANVLIYGETGTGKELVAKILHYSGSRSDGPFVAVNVTALPENLVESELFGIEAGVATGVKKHIGFFEQADGGTLFIDEIGDMPLSSQSKILRALQERRIRRVGGTREISVDVRVIAATNKDLQQEMASGHFREDLYYRVGVLELRLPPLRERTSDVPLLVTHFIDKYQPFLGKKVSGFTPEALKLLMAYSWPGNVRELENEVERSLTLAREGEEIGVDDLSTKVRIPGIGQPIASEDGPNLRQAVDRLERQMIIEALDRYDGNKSRVARELGLSRLGLQKKMDRLGLR